MSKDSAITAGGSSMQGPPEFLRAVEMQREYWTHNAREQADLEAQDVPQLGWRDLLRLHHLICLERVNSGVEREPCREVLHRLLAGDSPYRPRPALIWKPRGKQPSSTQEPNLQGEFLNASLTHLGCLEIYRIDAANQPIQVDFVGFDELSGVVFDAPALVRMAKLFYEGGRSEIVQVPMLYGLTWTIGNEHDRAGLMTRFVAHLQNTALPVAAGIGVGQQDFCITGNDNNHTVFGLGSVAQISFPLDMRDHRFDEKARERGMDPDEIRTRAHQ
jgi:hypothetical protein